MKTAVDEDEVEQLLRAAQDDALLKLSVNSHIARASSDAINPDLDRRFQALKNRASAPNTKPPPKIDSNPPNNSCGEKSSTVGNDDVSGADDLFARFAMLKKSLPAYNSNGVGVGEYKGDSSNYVAEEDNSSDEDEVEKLIKWAVDAARLDPSPPSDDDDDHGDQTDDDHDKDDDEDDEDDIDDAKKRKAK